MTWEEMTSMAAEEGFAAADCDRHEGHSLRSVVPAAVRRESLRQIRRKLQLSARLRHAGRDARAHSGAPPCPRAPDDLGDRRLQRLEGHQGSEKGAQRRNAAPARPPAPRGRAGFPVGASGCALCETCAIVEHEPCRYPDLYYSCMSAYCIFVRRLAEQCGMEYDCGPGLLAFFGMYVFD